MKYIFCFVLLIFLVCEYSKAETLQLTNFHRNYRDYQNENLLEELNYAEISQKSKEEIMKLYHSSDEGLSKEEAEALCNKYSGVMKDMVS